MTKCSRKQLEKYTIWIDKEIKKHKHNFCIPCILEERELGKNYMGNNHFINYYNIRMCDKCHSFKMVSEPGNIEGRITSHINNTFNKELINEQEKTRHVIGIRNCCKHGISHIEELYFPDKTKWKKC